MDENGSLLLYLISVNIIVIFFMKLDKQRAKTKQWRIPERTFWGLSVIGGSLGMWFAMRFFRHKTKHRSFTVGVPVLLLVQAGIAVYLYFLLS